VRKTNAAARSPRPCTFDRPALLCGESLNGWPDVSAARGQQERGLSPLRRGRHRARSGGLDYRPKLARPPGATGCPCATSAHRRPRPPPTNSRASSSEGRSAKSIFEQPGGRRSRDCFCRRERGRRMTRRSRMYAPSPARATASKSSGRAARDRGKRARLQAAEMSPSRSPMVTSCP
jgi:hypothetical protein